MKHWVISLLILLLFYTGTSLVAQSFILKDSIIWESTTKTNITKELSFTSLHFKGNVFVEANHSIPFYSKKISIPTFSTIEKIKITNIKYVPLTKEEVKALESSISKQTIDSLTINTNVYQERKKTFVTLSFCPVVINKSTQTLEKITHFEIEISTISKGQTKDRTYAANSILASGNWKKFSSSNEGVHIIRRQDLIIMGYNPSNTDPANVSIFGNGGTPLPENNAYPRLDDLQECAISVSGGGDGSFDDNDYILFYAKSPVGWTYNPSTNQFNYKKNTYSDRTYFFITFDATIGEKKRIQTIAPVTTPATKNITHYLRYLSYEKERVNLTKSGSDWLGETFDVTTTYTFPFRISNLDLSKPIKVGVKAASKASQAANFNINIGSSSQTMSIEGNTYSQVKAIEQYQEFVFNPLSTNVNLTISYSKPTALAVGWLNYITMFGECYLSQTDPQIFIHSTEPIGSTEILNYSISNASTSKVWDVTDFNNIKEIPTQITGTNSTFISKADSIRDYVVFSGQSYYPIQYHGDVENQNLHGLSGANMVIIAHPNFINQANRLKEFHQTNRGLSVQIVTPNQIFNEFGSGAPDIVAIRDFSKMYYDKFGPSTYKYLLLFGDASYDFRNVLGFNQNFVPTYENEISTNEYTSFSSDDFYGLLDDNEGQNCAGLLDIGIGRFVVKSETEAKEMVDKTILYCQQYDLTKYAPDKVSNFGDWRNNITIIADDQDGNTHLATAYRLSDIIEQRYPSFNIEKIFFDAYPQVSNSGGQRYPDVETAINERMRKGTLLMNYVGHGGEVGWAHERVLRISDINSWENRYNLPIMFTATCEFTRYDDPERVSAGELVHLNAGGGAAALFTTSRVAWSSTNDFLCINFFNNAFEQSSSNTYHSLGDLVRISKNLDPGSWANLRNFILIGDPSITFAFPKYKVKTTHINNHPSKNIQSNINTRNLKDTRDNTDTLKALSHTDIKGIITDNLDNKLTSFNGEIIVTVFDKPSAITTLGNDPESPISTFNYQKNIIFKGKAKVTNGDFSISFIIPKDISYNYGYGKISYYAKCDTADASGHFSNIIIGGFSDNPVVDNDPPEIKLYLNDLNFTNMGLTNENPQLIAKVSDSTGINIMGNTIGHDAVITLDKKSENSIVVNDYFETELNSYQKGTFTYPLKDLSEGKHTLTFKVWDILNNSSEQTIEFTVVKDAQLALDHVLNYPNPFSTHTNFFFEHNQPEMAMDVKIQIFTITGKLVKTIVQNTQMNGFRSEGILWNGTDDFGDKIAKGVYLYKLSARTSTGKYSEKIEKLVIL